MSAQTKKAHHLKLLSNLLAIAFALVSLMILKLHTGGFWVFTWIICIITAILFILQSVYLSLFLKQNLKLSLWRNIFYWLGFLVGLYLTTLMLQYGIIGHQAAGFFALILLAITLFLHGLIDDLSSTVAGIGLALMLAGAIIIQAYLLLVIIPIAIIIGFLIFILIRKKNKAPKKK